MTLQDSHPGRRLLLRWVAWAERYAAFVVALALLVTAAAAYVTVTRIGINTSTTDMLSAELPFRRHAEALDDAFPQFSDTLVVVVEAATPGGADDAATALARAMQARPALFRDVFYPEGHPFFRRNGLLYLDIGELETLSDRLAEAQPMLSALAEDPSLRGLSNLLRQAVEEAPDQSDETVAAVAVALDRIAESVESVAAAEAGDGMARPLSWTALMTRQEPAPEDLRRLIVVQPVLDFETLEPAAKPIAAVRDLAGGLDTGGIGRGVRVRLTGSAMMFQDELRSVREGMGMVGLLSLSLVLGLLVLALRSATLVVATMATLLIGLVWTAAFAALAIGELNLISIAFAVLFIGLSVDFGIHYALRYREAVAASEPSADEARPLTAAGAGVGGALALCALAAAVGFFSFLPTAYRGLSELGLISGVGMFVALFANLTILPAMLRLLPGQPRGAMAKSVARASVGRAIERRPWAVLAGAGVLGVGALMIAPSARFDDDPLNLRDPKSESVATFDALAEDPRLQPYSVSVLAEDLPAAQTIAERLGALAPVEEAVTLSDFVPSEQDDKLAIIDQMGVFLAPLFTATARPPPDAAESRRSLARLRAALVGAHGALDAGAQRLAAALERLDPTPEALARLDRALLGGFPGRIEALVEALGARRVTLDDLPEQVRDRYVAADGRVKVDVIPSEDLRAAPARRRFVDAVTHAAPRAAGTPIAITAAGRAVVQAFGEAAAYAVGLISLLLLLVLRSLRDALLVLAPLVLAALLTIAATVVFDVPFNFANVIVLPLLFGLGVAGGIHIVTRARVAGVARLMATSTPRAVLFSALTTIGSFCALALSSHRGMASMGFLLTIAITLSMLSTLVVLPALMSVVRGRGGASGSDGGLLRGLAVLGGLALLGFLLARTDVDEVWSGVLALGPLGALAALGVFFAAFLADTASWQLMLPSVRLDARWLYRLWKVRMVGEALNLVIPAGSVGGEPFKAILLKKTHGLGYREAAASLVMTKTVNLLALVLFSGVGFTFMLEQPILPDTYHTVAGVGLGALGIGVIGFYAVQRWRAASRLARWLARRQIGRGLERFLEQIQGIDNHFERFYARQPLRFAAAFVLAYGNWLLGMTELYVIMRFLDRPISWADAWLIETVHQLVRAGSFFVPASLGVSEAAMVLIYGALAGSPSIGLAVALIRRGRELVWIGWGLGLGWLYSLTPATAAAARRNPGGAGGGGGS